MDYEMDSVENVRSDSDLLRDLDWQIDSEWVKVPASSGALPSGNVKKRNKNGGASSLRAAKPTFAFTQNTKGERLLIIEQQAFRFSKKTDSGFSYWVCNIPFCNSRCFLDPFEKEIVRYAGEHNHDTSVSRPEYKSFIHSLKLAVKEKPHVKPREIYDNEFEKLKKVLMESGVRKSGDDLGLPTFDDVRTAMYNTRNAVLSSVSLRPAEEVDGDLISKHQSSTRSTRSKEGKVIGKRKQTPTKSPMALSTADLEELEGEWTLQSNKEANLSDFEDWLEEDRNANISSVVSPRKKQKSIAARQITDLDAGSLESDEATDEERSEEWGAPSSGEILDDSHFCFLPSHPDNQMLIVNDYLLHHINLQHAGCSYWECCHKDCDFRAVHSLQHKNVIKTTGVHSHSSQLGLLQKWKFITTVRMRAAVNPKLSAKEIYQAEVEIIKRQIEEELSAQWNIPSFSFVKNFLCAERNVTPEDVSADEEIILPTTIEEFAGRDVTEAEREFLDEPSEQADEVSGMNFSLLAPKVIKSKNFPDLCFYFVPSRKGKRILVVNDFTFHLNTQKSGSRFYWKCTVESCAYRCVYNHEINDFIKVNGKHTHMTNVHQLRSREFVHLLKSRLKEDPTLTPKVVYEEELEKLRHTTNGMNLIGHMPAFASIRTSLYNLKNKKNYDSTGADFTSSFSSANLDSEKAQDISPKAITHLSLEDNENMDYDHDARETFPNQTLSSSLEIATPSLYDNHDIIEQISDGDGLDKMSSNQLPQFHAELEVGLQNDSKAVQSTYTATLVPTNRGGQALAVNDCVLRSSFARDSVTYWRCQQKECPFKCSYDTKTNKLLRVNGKHNHAINPWNVHIRSFVKRLKKRISQGSHVPLKLIYEQEITQLKKEGKNNDFVSRLPSFESLKTALYKARRQSMSLTSGVDLLDCSEDLNVQKGTELTNYQGSEMDRHEYPRMAYEAPPEDVVIDMIYSPLDTQLTSWLGHDSEKRVIDGHLLVKKSSADTSTGWICSKKGCLFRCVIDNESKTVLRGKWYHTHRSEVRHVIIQTIFGAVKRRVITATKLNPKNIYDEERRRMENKIEKNPALLKFIPSYAQVYQLILRTKAKQSPHAKQESLSQTGAPKPSVIIRNTLSESQNNTSLNPPLTTEIEQTITMMNDKSSQPILPGRCAQDPHQDQRNAAVSQSKMHNNCAMEGVACMEEMDPNFGYDHHSLHQLADFDYPIGEPSVNHEPLGNQTSVRHESTTNAMHHLGPEDHELNLNVNVSPTTGLIRLNQEASVAHTNPKQHLDYLDSHHFRDFHSFDYHPGERQPSVSSQFSYNTHMAQGPRISSSDPHSGQQMMSQHIHPPPHPPPPPPHNQSSLPGNLGTTDLDHETTSFLPTSFLVPSSLPSSSSSSSSSVFMAPSSHQPVYQNSIPQQSPVDKNVFTLHGYPVFPASAQTGSIYWQCRVPDCHFQCVYNVGTGQMVQISGNHNHEPPCSQQTLSSQVTKMLLRKAVEDLDKPIYNVYSDYMQALHNLLDSNSIFNGFPRYEDVAMAMQNARNAMGINSEVDPKLMLLQPSQTKNLIESSSQDEHVHGAESYAEFALNSVNNRLILHGEEMVFLWRQNEILHWRCRKSDCSFKCVYDEEIQSLHVLNHHSPHCASSSKEMDHSPATKRRSSGDIFIRSSKCPRLDQ